MKARRLSIVVACLGGFVAAPARVGADEGWVNELKRIDATALPAGFAASRRMLAADVRARVQAVNLKEDAAWGRVTSLAEWEAFRDKRIEALRASLGPGHDAPKPLKVAVTRTLEGDGFRIENLVYETRPGFVVTANLYRPARANEPMPAILIVHSHHKPENAGRAFARHGDDLGAARLPRARSRPQRPRRAQAASVPNRRGLPASVSRGAPGLLLPIQRRLLQPATSPARASMRWNVADLMRGVDLLLARPGVGRDRVILLGSVAGGGDPAAVAAALDPRIKAVAAFNFGGPQPDYTLPDNPARDFYWFGVPDWESTR